jgi:protein involved in polysaccharide export with SLBB domain
MSIYCRYFAILGMALSITLYSADTSAQGFNPTPEQLRTYQQLSPADREALLQVLGDDTGVLREAPLAFPQLVRPEGQAANSGFAGALPDQIGGVNVSELSPLERALLLEVLEREAEPGLSELEQDLLQDLQELDEDEAPFFLKDVELKPFGYNLFAGSPTTFAPATDIPVPPDYKIGPGDTIAVQLFGKENRQYSLVVQRDGTLNFPNIGPIVVMGRNFQDLKQELLDRVSEDLIGTSAAISMGALRSIRVLIVGDAKAPGSYTVSGLSTVTNALVVSGGVSEGGTLRDIQVRRDGKVIRTIDLYDLLIRGDSQDDIRLQAGDTIFIPPIGSTVAVGGFVKRPAVYELSNEKTVSEMIELAGGLDPEAYPPRIRLERIADNWQRSFIEVDLTSPAGQNQQVRTGDIILVPPVLEEYQAGVSLVGSVERPGAFEWFEGMRLTDVIESYADLRPQSDINYVLIRRETYPKKRIEALSANLEVALESPDSAENLRFRSGN